LIVVDASVLAPALADDGTDGDKARARLSGEELAAPELIDLEVTSVWRRMVRRGSLPLRRASLALDDLGSIPLARVGHRLLLTRCWELRDSLTTYDASYVALAEALGVVLVTADRGISGASRIRCRIEVIV
jgi:predicted nucleic acid-binding protein